MQKSERERTAENTLQCVFVCMLKSLLRMFCRDGVNLHGKPDCISVLYNFDYVFRYISDFYKKYRENTLFEFVAQIFQYIETKC